MFCLMSGSVGLICWALILAHVTYTYCVDNVTLRFSHGVKMCGFGQFLLVAVRRHVEIGDCVIVLA